MFRNDPILRPEMQRKSLKICHYFHSRGWDQGTEWKFPLIFYLFHFDAFLIKSYNNH